MGGFRNDVGGGIGGGGFIYPDSATRPFTDIAARNTWADANTDDLIRNQTIVQVGTDWYLWTGTSKPATVDPNDWLDATPLIQGPPGTDGMDGTVLEFTDEASRDVFFTSPEGRALLIENLPILVTVAPRTVSIQTWSGEDQPTTYDGDLWDVASVRTGTDSLELAEVHRISSGGQNIFVINESSRLAFFAPYQFTGDHTQTTGRNVRSIPDARRYDPDNNNPPTPLEAGGVRAVSGSTPFNVNFDIQNFNTSLFGLIYVPEENYTGRITYIVTNTDTNIVVYTQSDNVVFVAGEEHSQWFRFPFETREGENLNAQLIKADRTIVNVRPEAIAPDRPYTTSQIRAYFDDPMLVTSAASAQLEPVIIGGENVTVVRDDENNTLTINNSLSPTPERQNPVDVGQTFTFNDGPQKFDSTVFNIKTDVQEINFSDNTVDIPNIDGEPYHVIGVYLVSEYPQGLVFIRVTGSTSTGGVGDIEGVIVGSISFTDGESFTPPNVAQNIRLGVMDSLLDPDTEVAFEQVRSGSGETLGSAFTHPNYTNTREIVYTLESKSEVDYALGLLSPNKHAIGPISGSSTDASVITSVARNPSNPLQLIVDLAEPVTGAANTIRELYDVTSELIRHLIVDSGANAEVSNSTLRITSAPSGGGGIEYTSPTPADNEIIIGTGESDSAAASGIVLNSEGNIPYEHIGDGDVVLSGKGGSFTIDVDNIAQYRDRTIFIDHTNTFTLNLDSIDDFHDADINPFFLRFVLLTNINNRVQGVTGETIGGQNGQRLEFNDSLTIELPDKGENNWPILAESFGNLTNRLIRGYQLVNVNTALNSSLNAHHLRKTVNAAVSVTIDDGLRSGSYFYFQNLGVSPIMVDTEGDETIEGNDSFPVERGYLYLITKDNTNVWRLFLIEFEPLIENGVPRYDSLAPGKSSTPGSATQEFLTFRSMWQGDRSLLMTINGTSISAFATSATNLTGGNVHHLTYAITESEWTDIYTPSPDELDITIQDATSSEVLYQTLSQSS